MDNKVLNNLADLAAKNRLVVNAVVKNAVDLAPAGEIEPKIVQRLSNMTGKLNALVYADYDIELRRKLGKHTEIKILIIVHMNPDFKPTVQMIPTTNCSLDRIEGEKFYTVLKSAMGMQRRLEKQWVDKYAPALREIAANWK